MLASHIKARLENAKKVKEKGPKLAGHEFKLGDIVVAQTPLSNLWDTHGIVTKRHSKRRFRIQADEGNSFSRNGKFIRLSATGPTPDLDQGLLPQDDSAPSLEVVVTGPKASTGGSSSSRELKKVKEKAQTLPRLIGLEVWPKDHLLNYVQVR